MQTFGSGFNIVIGTSSSLATGSISTGSFLQGINFIYADPRYTSSYYSGSIVSIEPVISKVEAGGAAGYLTFKLPDIADANNTSRKEAVRMLISGGESRVGIGFDTEIGDEPKFPLDIKSIKDTGEGTKFVLRHARPTKGAETGDTAGKILFTIDSGSFGDLESSGSAGSIESDILEADATGVTGDIIVKTSYVKNEAPTEVFRVNQLNSNFSSSLRVQGNQLTVDNTVVATYGRMDSLRIGPAAISPGTNNAYIHGNLNVNTSFTASGLNYPDTDGLDRQVIKTDGNGNLSFGYPEAITIAVKNVSGGSIPKGTPCYITASGTSGNVAGIIPADASNFNLMPAGVIAGETLADEAEGVGLVNGFIQGVDTSTFTSGDTVYIAVGGGYTNVKPTGSGVFIQKLGNVEKVDNTNGSGVINGPGYYNDLPNWEAGKVMVGTPTYPVTSSVLTLNEITSQLTIDGDTDISGDVEITGDLYLTGSIFPFLPSNTTSKKYQGEISPIPGSSLTAGKLYVLSSSVWTLTDISDATKSTYHMGVAIDSTTVMIRGYINNGLYAGFSTGEPLYAEDSGVVTNTIPSTSGDIVRVIGHSINGSLRTIYFNPSNDYSEVV